MNRNQMADILKQYDQEHVLKAFDRADSMKQETILQQVKKIDFEQMRELFAISQSEIKVENSKIEPMAYTDSSKLSAEKKKQYIEAGEEIIRKGKLAVVTMAGGQGTRLGHNGPKGTYDIGLASQKSLFELLTDYLKEASQKYGVMIPWYIMTSQENNADTVRFFEDNDFFGYHQEDIRFFKQGGLPMLDEQGKVMINEEGIIKEAASGHGGVFEAMLKEDVLKDMQERGIEWIFIGSIDNPLAKMADPLMIGFGAENHYLAVSKTLAKASPEEKVGVFCKKNGRPYVIEYTEISEEMANKRDENGMLLYGEGHVLLNLFHIEMLEKIKEVRLPYHSAHKKATFRDEEGNVIVPDRPNAYKYEAFIFDAFSLLSDMGLLRGKREDDFAPVKNATGEDSPETARKLYEDFIRRKREGLV